MPRKSTNDERHSIVKLFQSKLKRFGIKEKNYCKAVVLDENGEPDALSVKSKVVPMAQIVAGSATMIAGVPLLAVPFVGSCAVITGAGLALNGQRKLSGREATRAEYAIESAGNALVDTAKNVAHHTSNQAAKRVREASRDICEHMPKSVASAGSRAKDAVLSASESIPAHATSAVKTARQVGGVVAEGGPAAVAGVAAGAGAVAGVLAGAVYAGAKVMGKLK